MVSGDSHGSDGRAEMFNTADDDHVLIHAHSVC
jgi:signal-transduction protein with cAMP-binding, CBS, and nucleotidyltransferase domain